MLATRPRAAALLNDTAGVSLVHRFDEYAAAVGECYLVYVFSFHNLKFSFFCVSHSQYE